MNNVENHKVVTYFFSDDQGKTYFHAVARVKAFDLEQTQKWAKHELARWMERVANGTARGLPSASVRYVTLLQLTNVQVVAENLSSEAANLRKSEVAAQLTGIGFPHVSTAPALSRFAEEPVE